LAVSPPESGPECPPDHDLFGLRVEGKNRVHCAYWSNAKSTRHTSSTGAEILVTV